MSLRLETSDYSTSYVTQIVWAKLEGGSQRGFFLKDLGNSTRHKDEPQMRREREVMVYERILQGSGLGTPEYHGAVLDDDGGASWLLLELVEGTPVKYLDFEYWVASAAWLGRLQRYAHARLRAPGGTETLIRHNPEYFFSKAEGALETVSTISGSLRRRLAPIVERYESAVRAMTQYPATLVHGAFRPQNILIGMNPPRVCPVDWELSALGSPLYDLGFFSDGFAGEELERILNAYRDEAREQGMERVADEEMVYLMACFRMHRFLNWLSQGLEREYPVSEISKLVGLAERLADEIL